MVWEQYSRTDVERRFEPSEQVALSIVDAWNNRLLGTTGTGLRGLPECEMWKFMEAMELLVGTIIEFICGEYPSLSTFSLMDSLVQSSDCELHIIWLPRGGNLYGGAQGGCRVYRLADTFWPGKCWFERAEGLDANALELTKRWYRHLNGAHESEAF
jgi:hypothetical protein